MIADVSNPQREPRPSAKPARIAVSVECGTRFSPSTIVQKHLLLVPASFLWTPCRRQRLFSTSVSAGGPGLVAEAAAARLGHGAECIHRCWSRLNQRSRPRFQNSLWVLRSRKNSFFDVINLPCAPSPSRGGSSLRQRETGSCDVRLSKRHLF